MTILLVEHDMDFVMGLTDRLVVMDFGEKLAEGLPARDPAQSGRARSVSGRRLMTRATRAARSPRPVASPTARSRPCTTSRSRSSEGSIVTVIGPNGAGKTTLLAAIMGTAAGARRRSRYRGDVASTR